MALFRFLFPLFAGLFSATFAFAQSDEVFSDWQVQCGDEDQNCQMLQVASASEDTASVFLLSISRGQGGADDFAVLTVPLGVYMAPGIEIRVDQRRPFKVLYEICDQNACYAGFRLSGAALTALRQGLDAKVRVWTAKTEAVEFPVSLRGFSAAYQHYQSEILP